MKKKDIVVSLLIGFFIVAGTFGLAVYTSLHTASKSSNQQQLQVPRQIIQVPIEQNNTTSPTVEATKLPKFTYSLADPKFENLLTATTSDITSWVQATIVHSAYASDTIGTTVTVDKINRQLIVTPQNIAHFTPGLYVLSLTLRTLEGEVHIDQDFSWGVIAVNTNKSIYAPGETAKIGLGVLDDKGETLCANGPIHRVDGLEMTITDPQGKRTNLSLEDKTIMDSGKCGANTVTNDADFQANYITTTSGIYEMVVTATISGKQRQIEDYFKVDPNAQFDVERTSFPTRIYPPAPYPVTFTVTAKQNYSGTVEDIVPSFFAIQHISDNGKTQADGNFTKIIWNTTLTSGVAKSFTYFIQFPQVSPEFYLVGPITIGSFQEARQWQIASDALNSETGLFTAEDNTGSHTWYRFWTGSTWNPALGTSPDSMSAVPQDSRWFKEVSNPFTGEKLVGVEDNTGTDIYVFRWDGTTWNLDITMTTTIVGADSQYMDIGYNQLSGNAMLVYCDSGQTQVHYDRRINGTWDHSGTFASTVPAALGTATTQKTWVRIVPQANSDNMLIGYVDTSNFVGGFIWNGDTSSIISGSEIVDNAGTVASGHLHETFALAWETNDQVPMILWGNNNKDITYRRFTSGAWTTESTIGTTSYAANVDWVNAAPDDTSSSNNIAVASQNTGAAGSVGCDFAIWNGSSWTKYTTTTQTCTTDGFTRNNNVTWEHATGKAMFVFVSSANKFVLSYMTWQSGTFSSISTISGTETDQIKTVELYTDSNTVTILCIVTTVDSANTGNDMALGTEWDGSTWTALPTTNANALFAAVGGATDAEPEEAFGFGFDRDLETQASYRWFANSPGTDTSVNTPLTSENTPYTLTSGSQQFRLRLLLYYPDSLTSGTRTYNLQYVDPGTGTCATPVGGTPSGWTNVPNVGQGAGTISFYDNTSVASASAVTANAGLDPTYNGDTKVAETYNEQNTFTTNANTSGGQVGLFDFSLIDNTAFDRIAQTFCFRVARSNNLVVTIGTYPQMTTAALNDVIIKGNPGNTHIIGGSTLK